MYGLLLLLFIAVPLIDLLVLVRVGQHLGFWATAAAVVATGFAGAFLARWQGLRTLTRVQSELNAGRLPAVELADGAMMLFAAALLLTPGFLTDLFAIVLLLPFVRRVFRGLLQRGFKRRMQTTTVFYSSTIDGPSPVRPEQNVSFHATGEPSPRVKYVRNQSTDGMPQQTEPEVDRAES